MIKYRMVFTKGEEVRFISHLDYAEVIRRAILRAKLPVNYSEGFNPHMKMIFLAALALGVTSDAEYMDVELTKELTTKEIVERLSLQLPTGIELLNLKKVDLNCSTRKAQPDMAIYWIEVPLDCKDNATEIVYESFQRFNNEQKTVYHRITPKKHQVFDVKQYLSTPIEYEIHGQCLRMLINIRITPSGSVKASEILQLLKDSFQLPIETKIAFIHRKSVLYKNRSLIEWV